MSNPPFAPTEEQRRSVEEMAAVGVPQDDIARVIDIAPKTLRLHFRDELDLGAIKATTKVGQFLFAQATGGSVPAAIFWMKARAGWREKHEIDIAVRRTAAEFTDAELAALAGTAMGSDGDEEA